MQCPRCGAKNLESRASCWSCLAQLRPSQDSKVRKLDLKTTSVPLPEQIVPSTPAAEEQTAGQELVAPEPPTLEELEPVAIDEIPTPEPDASEILPTPEEPEELSVFGTDAFGVETESQPSSSEGAIDIHEIGVSDEDNVQIPDAEPYEDVSSPGHVLDLDTQSDKTGGIVPGLAYAPLESLEEPFRPAEDEVEGVFDLETDGAEAEDSSDEKKDE